MQGSVRLGSWHTIAELPLNPFHDLEEFSVL